jgi:hypothetical protein
MPAIPGKASVRMRCAIDREKDMSEHNSEHKLGYYLMKLEVGNVGMPGAPILHLNLGVYAPTGQINGGAEIDQALPPPYGKTIVPQVTGAIHHTGFKIDHRLITLRGEYVVTVPLPGIGAYLAQFFAGLVLNPDGTGRGTFIYGNHVVSDVPVKLLLEKSV